MTKDEYERKLQVILDQLLGVTEGKGWCSESWDTIVRLSPDFRVQRHECLDDAEDCDCDDGYLYVTSPELLPEDLFAEGMYARYLVSQGGTYDQRLRELRGRLLSLIGESSDYPVTADNVNQVLSAGGLETVPVLHRWEIGDIGQYFTTDHDDEGEARQLLREAWAAFTDVLGEITTYDGEGISVRYLTVTPEYDHDPQPVLVPGDLVPLL